MNDLSVVYSGCFVIGIVFTLTLIFMENSIFGLIVTGGVFGVGIFLYVFEWRLFKTPQQNMNSESGN